MFHVVRLATIHPALAHFTIGGLPLIVIAYAMAVWRRSPAWTLVGDAALVVTAALTLGTGPLRPGIERGGALAGRHRDLALDPSRLSASRRRRCSRRFAVLRLCSVARIRRFRRRCSAALVIVAGVAVFTGWVGGEVLVFHSGMAVRAAGDGALAPPVFDSTRRPKDFLDAMRQVRAAWAAINTRLAWMLVQHPRDEDFAAHRARRAAHGRAHQGDGRRRREG